MNPETHTRAQARTEAAQKYHAMLAELYEMKPKPFQYVPVAGFPFRDELCREVALLACSQLEAEDTRLVFEFLGLEPSGFEPPEPAESAAAIPCDCLGAAECATRSELGQCPRDKS